MTRLLVILILLGPWLTARSQTCRDDILPSTPASDFIDNANGTVTHRTTGLTWMRCSLGQTWKGASCGGTALGQGWQRALQAAADFNAAGGYTGRTDWRLPNQKELLSLVEDQCSDPTIRASVFPNTPSSLYLSASHEGGSNWVWVVNFENGYGLAAAGLYVRLVRGGTTAGLDDHGNTADTATNVAANSRSVGLIKPRRDSDYFRIRVRKAGTLTLSTIGNTDTYGYLLNSRERTLDANDNVNGSNFQIIRAVKPGIYFVRVRHSERSGTGRYTLVSKLVGSGG